MTALLDSTFLIAAEWKGLSPSDVIRAVKALGFRYQPAISVITIVELAHGEARAETPHRAHKRSVFLTDLQDVLKIVPVTGAIARRAGQLEGALATAGNKLAFADVLIAATAMALDATVVTRNTRHFDRIPGLRVVLHP